VIPVVLEMPGSVGYLLVGVVMLVAAGNYAIGVRQDAVTRR
jgi:hypothetical protein